MTFVENRGQTKKQVRYIARGAHFAFNIEAQRKIIKQVLEIFCKACREAEIGPGRVQRHVVVDGHGHDFPHKMMIEASLAPGRRQPVRVAAW